MTALISIMFVAWVSILIISIYEWAKNIFFAPPIFEEGDNYIIIENTENTKFPEKYSEGVFAWYQNGELQVSEEYQIANGGDPMVLKKYLLKTNLKKAN
jgi:hypothetical protein